MTTLKINKFAGQRLALADLNGCTREDALRLIIQYADEMNRVRDAMQEAVYAITHVQTTRNTTDREHLKSALVVLTNALKIAGKGIDVKFRLDDLTHTTTSATNAGNKG